MCRHTNSYKTAFPGSLKMSPANGIFRIANAKSRLSGRHFVYHPWLIGVGFQNCSPGRGQNTVAPNLACGLEKEHRPWVAKFAWRPLVSVLLICLRVALSTPGGTRSEAEMGAPSPFDVGAHPERHDCAVAGNYGLGRCPPKSREC